MFGASFIHTRIYVFLCSHIFGCIMNLLFVLCVDKVHPRLKRRYHARLEKVKEYLGTIKDFDELIFPQSLFLHFLGLEPSSKVRKNIKIVKKSEYADFIFCKKV